MKKQIKQCALLFLGLFAFTAIHAQSSNEITDSVLVNGNCGMCKKNIEKSAMDAGATYAFWNKKTKMLNVKFDPSKTSQEQIENKIAAKGYDTQNVKASDEAYQKLEECCQYERKEMKPAKQ